MDAGRAIPSRFRARPGDEPIPGYRLVRRRGRGGFAEVWEAEAAGGFRVALKIVRLPAEDRTAEARALAVVRGIRHPNLLVSFGAWEVEGALIVGMELADGSLWDRFTEAEDRGLLGIPRGELLGYLADVASGIDHLNEPRHTLDGRAGVGVQHRDLKPQNILLFGGGAKAADFGESQVMDGPSAPVAGSWTPAYAAPEFYEGRTSDRSDQYALAVTYCQLRGGRLPFVGPDVVVMAGHLHGTPDLDGLPEPERPILARALAKRPEDRWPDCSSLIGALKALTEAEGCEVPETLPGPSPDPDDYCLGRRADSGAPSATTTTLGLITFWDDMDVDAELAALGEDTPAFLDDPTGPDLLPLDPPDPAPPAHDAPAGHPGRRYSRARGLRAQVALAVLTAGLLLASTGARTSVQRPDGERSPARLERTGATWRRPDFHHRVLRPPMLVTSTVGDALGSRDLPADGLSPILAVPVPAIEAEAEPLRPPDDAPAEDASEPAPGLLPSVIDPRAGPWDGPAKPALPVAESEALSFDLPEVVDVRAGESTRVRVRLVGGEDSSPAKVRFSGIPREITVNGGTIAAGSEEAEVVVSAGRSAPPSAADLEVVAERAGQSANARLRIRVLPSAASEAYARGREALSKGDRRRAIEEFGAAIGSDPGHAWAYCYRGVAAHLDGRPREALADYSEAIRLDPDNNVAYAARGRIHYEAGDLPRALADYSEAIRLRPGNAITLSARGRILDDLGQYARALADASEAIRLRPGDAEARYRRGLVRYHSGDNAGAVADFTGAIRLDPSHAWAYRRRADAFARLGDADRAFADHAMVDRLAPDASRRDARPDGAP